MNMGKVYQELIFSESKHLPLIPKSTFEKWITNHEKIITEEQKKKLEKLEGKLYIDNKEDHGDIPLGILALYKLARQPCDSILAQSLERFIFVVTVTRNSEYLIMFLVMAVLGLILEQRRGNGVRSEDICCFSG